MARHAFMRPLGTKVLLAPVASSQDTEQDGIIIPEAHRTPPKVHKVVAVGDRVSGDLATGDLVLLSPHYATTVTYAGVPHVLCKESEILCKITTN